MRFVTAGESHGPALTSIVSDVPAGIFVSSENINFDLARRQSGYGRGGRMKIERDTVSILSGVRFSHSIGSPITLQIRNRDWESWTECMAVEGVKGDAIVRETSPRPGHADLVGVLKTDTDDCRDILERASARETAARVAAGGIARAFLAQMGVSVESYVTRIGSAALSGSFLAQYGPIFDSATIEASECRCPDSATTETMKAAIDDARSAGESLGGHFVVFATGLVPGLGGYASSEARLTSRLGGAVFSIPAIKGVEFGMGFASGELPGSEVHDPIAYTAERGIHRLSNNAGGLEGGMTTGEPLVLVASMKPIPTLMRPLKSIDLDTLEEVDASKERSDVCAVPAAAVVAEAEVAMVLADAYLEKFGRDNITDILVARDAYLARIAR